MTDTPLPIEGLEPQPLEGIILTPEDPGALVSVSRPDPVAIFTTPQLVDAILARVAELALDFTPNLTTKAGRAEVASRARRVASTKVYLDDLGKAEVARLKDLPRQIDAGRKTLRDGFDALKDRVRKPLDAWEAEDAAQQAEVERLTGDVKWAKGALETSEARFDHDLETAIAPFKAKLDDIKAKLDDIKAKLDDIKAKLDDIKALHRVMSLAKASPVEDWDFTTLMADVLARG